MRRPIRISAALLLVAATTTSGQAPSLTYKGIALGASQAEYKARFPHQMCTDTRCSFLPEMCTRSGAPLNVENFRACRNSNTFGGVFPSFVSAEFRDGQLIMLMFSFTPSEFDALTEAVKERLGASTSSRDFTVRNRIGTAFDNREQIWERPDIILRVVRYGSNLERGSAMLTTRAELARKAAEIDQRKSAGAKDF